MTSSIFGLFMLISLLNIYIIVFPTVIGEVINFPAKRIVIKESINCNKSSENNCLKRETNYNKSVNNDENENLKNSFWFSNIPLLPIVVATSNSIPEGPCKKQLNLYLRHLKNGTLWATEMFDSSAKYPYGIFDGHTRHLGSFDQCYRLHTTVPSDEEGGKLEEIRSRYCLVDIKYTEKNEPIKSSEKLDIWFDLQGSAWEAIREKGDFRRYQRYLLQMALCVPASCYPKDIASALKEPLEKFGSEYNIEVQVSVKKDHCQASHEAKPFSNYAVVYCVVFVLLIVLVIIGTNSDKNSDVEKKKSLKEEILFCFSARRSLNSIFSVNYRHRGFDCLHMLRFILSSIVVAGHRQIQNLHAANLAGRFYELTEVYPLLTPLAHNGSIVVDGFFGLGGLVLSYQLLEYFEKANRLNIPLWILKRFLRLIPLYAFIVFAYAVLFHHLGTGPFWENRFGLDRDSCSSYWWSNILFINNYINGKNSCVLQSWYIIVDFQCFVIGLFLLAAFCKMSRKVGYTFLGSVFILSSAIPFYITYKYNVEPLFKPFPFIRRIEDYDYFTDYYRKTHMRLPAYVVGIIMGALIYDYKFATWRISKTWSPILFILLVVVLSLVTQNLGFYFMDPNNIQSLFARSLYASLHRPIIAFSMCSVALVMTISDGLDTLYNVLTPAWVQPISKLSYGVFLLHFLIQSYDVGTARTPFVASIYFMVRYYFIDFIQALVLSLFFAVIIEEPFKRLGNLILMKKEPPKSIASSEAAKKLD